MRYLAIDYGLKRIGLAICDADEIIVSPLCQIQNSEVNRQMAIDNILSLIREHAIEQLVIGLPVNMDGTMGEQARISRNFGKKLEEQSGLKVNFQDERLSSRSADRMLADSGFTRKGKKARRDMLAACEILKDFLGQ